MGTEFYEILARSPLPARTGLLLELIENHPEGRLQLPAGEGGRAPLEGIDLSRALLLARLGDAAPRWWDAQQQGIDLRHADLRGASLRGANLAGAMLEGADLSGADLAGANLEGAVLDGAHFAGAFVEDANLRGARLRFARMEGLALEGSNLSGADLWGAHLTGADLDKTDLRNANLTETDVSGADIRESDLRGANLSRANFRNALLNGSDLQTAAFKGANFAGAVLRDAKLQGATLTDCNLTHAHFADAWLDRTRLLCEQLGDAIGEELAGEYELARRGYLALERNFDETGETDASSWAYGKKRRMQKLEAWRRARTALGKRGYVEAGRFAFRYGSHLLTEYVCGYGESISRVLFSMATVFLLFALLYGALGSIVRGDERTGVPREVTRRPVDLALYSLTAMISPGNPPEAIFPASDGAQLLTGAQSFLGVFLIGLLGFVAGNRIRR